MKTITSNMIKILVLMTTFQLFSTVSSASVFGFNLPSPKNVIKIGFAPIPQFLDRFTHHPKQDYNSGFVNPTAFTDNRNTNNFYGNPNSFNPTSNNNPQVYPSIPQQEPDYVNNVTPGKSQNSAKYNQQPHNDNSGSYDSIEDSTPLPPEKPRELKIEHNNLINENSSEMTDINLVTTDTTTSDYEWTTTDEILNRIGEPPAIIASLLG